jgi:phage terminase small subunit
MARTSSSAANPKTRTKRGMDAVLVPATIEKLRKTKVNNSSAASVALVDPNKPLTEKQKLFVKFWAQGESILSASIKAGYSDGGTMGYRLARMPQIVAIYEKEKAAYMTRKKVMEGFLDGIEMAKLLAEPANVIAGWREIAKMCGYYEPVKKTVEVNLNGNLLVERVNRLTDAELLEFLQETARKEIEAADGDDEEAA